MDPLVALEKTTEALKRQELIERPRIESLQVVSDKYNNDPYALSLKVRRKFREEKKIEKAIKAQDDEVKQRYGLPEALPLVRNDPSLELEAKEQFREARRDMQAEGRHPVNSSKTSLSAATLLRNSLKKPGLASSRNNHDRSSRTSKSLGISIRK